MSSLGLLAAKFNLAGNADSSLQISEVALTSNFVAPGALFIAAPGAKRHGIEFLDQAVALGAIALLTDRPGDYPLPTLIHPDPRLVAGLIAAEVYSSSHSTLFGVTGTNGKTSTAYYLERLLCAAGHPAGLISSAEQIIGGEALSAELTTPEAPRLHQLLSQMRQQGENYCALEVSAQALVRNRVDGLRFKVAGFSNLSRDHLDDFGDMQNYLSAKSRLFTPELAEMAVVNLEDQWGRELFEKIRVPKLGIGPGYDFQYELTNGQLNLSGAGSASINFSGGKLMAKNLALAAAMVLAAEIEIPSEIEIAADVPGRLQRISELEPHVYVDYAHTPAGVSAVVNELVPKYERLIVVLGASGNRDRGKRAQMAQACAPAAMLIITDQHPRDEDPAEIRRDLATAAEAAAISHISVADPTEAIAHAISIANRGDAVLWCGPGHLKYREISGTKVAFDAVKTAREAQL